MDFDKILGVLQAKKLDESDQEEIKKQLQSIVELEATRMVSESLETEKERLVEEYEDKFEDYKKDITSKFSNFVDSVLDEELTIPDRVLEYAYKGELYEPIIEGFKQRMAIDEGLLDDEVKDILKEAKEEIVNLRKELNESYQEVLEVKEDAKAMASELYIRKKVEGLSEDKKESIMSLLEGVTDKGEIDRKFAILVEEVVEDSLLGDGEKGRGSSEILLEEKKEESKDPFNQYLDSYLKTAKNGI